MDLLMWCKKKEPQLYDERYWRFPEFTADRTIRILFSNKNWLPAYEKKSYDPQYGTVRLRRYDKEDNHLRCLIEFEDKAVVDKILSDGHLYINDHRIKVEAISVLDSDPAHMTNDLILPLFDGKDPSSNEYCHNKFSLDTLNNDCLRIIFRKIHMWTLWSVANTCVRFNELAKETFHLRYMREQFRFCDVFTEYPIPLQQIEAFLETFGQSIEQLFIGPHEFNYFDEYPLKDVLLLLSKNCPHLKDLDMRKLVVDYTIWNECMPLFSQLESLNLTFANTDMNHVQPTVLPKLASFKIRTRHYEHMQSFLQNDWPLEELSIRSFVDLQEVPHGISQLTQANWSTFFRLICEHCASVKKLSVLPTTTYYKDNNFSTNVMWLSELKHLRHLRLDFNLRYVRPLLEKMLENSIQLEYLEIKRGKIGVDEVDVISQFKSITTLKVMIHCSFTLQDLIRFAERLPCLSKLSFSEPDLLLDPTFDRLDMLIPIVSNGKRLSRILVEFSCELGEYTDKKYEELLAVVKKRATPIKLKITFVSIRYGPHTTAHFSERKSNPDCLTIEAMF